jgi:hypothetical protein
MPVEPQFPDLSIDAREEATGPARSPACLRHCWEHDDPGDDEGGAGYRRLIRTVWDCADPQAHGHQGQYTPASGGQASSLCGVSRDGSAAAAERASAPTASG